MMIELNILLMKIIQFNSEYIPPSSDWVVVCVGNDHHLS